MNEKLQEYIDYINNTAMVPLPVAYFDEDWEPVGPIVRDQMVAKGLIQVRKGGIYLRPDLVAARATP